MTVIRTLDDACPHCEAMRRVQLVRATESMTIRGEDVPFESEFYLCTSCGKNYADLDQIDADIEAARAVYRERHGIISPKEIVSLRARYDISQKAFGKILDIGELTINSYERGTLPSGAHNSLLRLVETPENFTRLYELHKAALSPRQRAKVERALRASGAAPTAEPNRDMALIREAEPAYGAEKPDASRLLGIIQLLVDYIGRPCHKMAVLKQLFYVDFSYYRRHGHCVSGWRYAHLPFGPVPEDFKRILARGEAERRFSLLPDAEEIGELITLPADYEQAAAEAEFDPSELEVIRAVAAKLGGLPASALRDLTHEEDAWLETDHAKEIPFAFAESLRHGV